MMTSNNHYLEREPGSPLSQDARTRSPKNEQVQIDTLIGDLIHPWKVKQKRKLERAPAVISAYSKDRDGGKRLFAEVVKAFGSARKARNNNDLPIIQVTPDGGLGLEQLLDDEDAQGRGAAEFQHCLRKSGLVVGSGSHFKKLFTFLLALVAWYWAEGAKPTTFGTLHVIASVTGGGVGWFISGFMERIIGSRAAERTESIERLKKRILQNPDKLERLHERLFRKLHESARVVVVYNFQSLDDLTKKFFEAYFETYNSHSQVWLDERVEVWFFCDHQYPANLRTMLGRAGTEAFVPDYLKQPGQKEDEQDGGGMEVATAAVPLRGSLPKATYPEARLLAAFAFYGGNTLSRNSFHEIVAEDEFNKQWAERLVGPDYRKLNFGKLQKVAARLCDSEDAALMDTVLKPLGGGTHIWFGRCPGPLIHKSMSWAKQAGVERAAAFLVLRLTHLEGRPLQAESWPLVHHLLEYLLNECQDWVREEKLERDLWQCAYLLRHSHLMNLRFDKADEWNERIADRCPCEEEFQDFGPAHSQASVLRTWQGLEEDQEWEEDSPGHVIASALSTHLNAALHSLQTEASVHADFDIGWLPDLKAWRSAAVSPSDFAFALDGFRVCHFLWNSASNLLLDRDSSWDDAQIGHALELAGAWESRFTGRGMRAIEELAGQSLALAARSLKVAATLTERSLPSMSAAGAGAAPDQETHGFEDDIPGPFSQYFIGLSQIEGSLAQLLCMRDAARFLCLRYSVLAGPQNLARTDGFLELLTEEAYGPLLQNLGDAAAAAYLFLADDARQVYGSVNNDKTMRYAAEAMTMVSDGEMKFSTGSLLFQSWAGDGHVTEARREFVKWLGMNPRLHERFASLDIFCGDEMSINLFLLFSNFQVKSFDAELKTLSRIFQAYGGPDCRGIIEDVNRLNQISDPPQEQEVREACAAFSDKEYAKGKYLHNVLVKLKGTQGHPWLVELCHEYLRDYTWSGASKTTLPVNLASALEGSPGVDGKLILSVLLAHRDIYQYDHPKKGLDVLVAICRLQIPEDPENLALRRTYAARTVEYFLDHELRGLAAERQCVVAMLHLLDLLERVKIAVPVASASIGQLGSMGYGVEIGISKHELLLLVDERFWRDLLQTRQGPVTGTDIVQRAGRAWQQWGYVYQDVEFRARLQETFALAPLDKLTARMTRQSV